MSGSEAASSSMATNTAASSSRITPPSPLNQGQAAEPVSTSPSATTSTTATPTHHPLHTPDTTHVPRSRRTSHRSVRSTRTLTLNPPTWRALAGAAQPVAASVSAVHVGAPSNGGVGTGTNNNDKNREGGGGMGGAAVLATRAIRDGEVRRRASVDGGIGREEVKPTEDPVPSSRAYTKNTLVKEEGQMHTRAAPRRPSLSVGMGVGVAVPVQPSTALSLESASSDDITPALTPNSTSTSTSTTPMSSAGPTPISTASTSTSPSSTPARTIKLDLPDQPLPLPLPHDVAFDRPTAQATLIHPSSSSATSTAKSGAVSWLASITRKGKNGAVNGATAQPGSEPVMTGNTSVDTTSTISTAITTTPSTTATTPTISTTSTLSTASRPITEDPPTSAASRTQAPVQVNVQPPTPAVEQSSTFEGGLPFSVFPPLPRSSASTPIPAPTSTSTMTSTPTPLVEQPTPLASTTTSKDTSTPSTSTSTPLAPAPIPDPAPTKKRSWFASPVRRSSTSTKTMTPKGSAPTSPTAPSFPPSTTISEAYTNTTIVAPTPISPPTTVLPAFIAPSPVGSGLSSSPMSTSASTPSTTTRTTLETPRAPTPPPALPKTPPPTYPLELQLDVNGPVDARAMMPPHDVGEEEADEEPPVYTASEQAARDVRVAKRKERRDMERRDREALAGAVGGVEEDAPVPDAVLETGVKEGGGNAGEGGVSGRDASASASASGERGGGTGGGGGGFMMNFPLLGRAKVLGRVASLDSLSLGGRKDPVASTSTSTVIQESGGASNGSVVTDSNITSTSSPLTSADPTSSDVSPPPITTHIRQEADPEVQANTQEHPQPQATRTDPDELVLSRSRPSYPTQSSSPEPEAGASANLGPTITSAPTTSAAPASWWDYVGWGAVLPASGAGTNANGPTMNGGEVTEVQEAAKRNEDATRLVEEEAERRRKEEDMEAERLRLEIEKEKQEENAKKIEEEAAAAAKGSELATWLSPWSWYYSSTSITTTASHTTTAEIANEDASANALPAESDATPIVDVSEEVLTSSPVEEPQLILESAPSFEVEAANSILASVSTHKSGWVSFFSSPALIGRTLGYGVGNQRAIEDVQVKRDENGVEVMELDFDEDVGTRHDAQTTSTSAGAVERGRGEDSKPVGGEIVLRPGTRAGLPVSTSSAPTTRDPSPRVASISNDKVPPIKISAEVKKEGAKLRSRGNSRVSSAASTPVRGRSPAMSDRTRTVSSGTVAAAAGTSTASAMTTTSSTTAAATTTSTMTTTTTTSTISTSATASSTISRPASPLPAKKPAPPNLVLPTWADTFGVAPRSVPPPRPPPKPVQQASTSASISTHPGVLGKTLKFMNNVLFAKDGFGAPAPLPGAPAFTPVPSASAMRKGKGKQHPHHARGMVQRTFSSGSTSSESEEKERPSLIEQDRQRRFALWGKELPKAWSIIDSVGRVDEPGVERGTEVQDTLRGCRRVVVIGVHGWFPGAMIRSVLGEPTGTSTKFANMMEQALRAFEIANDVSFDKVTKIPLEGDGTIAKRVDKLYANLQANDEWMSDLHDADAVLVATHSQGCVVSTHLLERLVRDGHIVTRTPPSSEHSNSSTPDASPIPARDHEAAVAAGSAASLDAGGGMASLAVALGLSSPPTQGDFEEDGSASSLRKRKVQRVCVLALCGIHLGPLRYLSSSTLVGPYLQYFESTAARELFEFQNTESAVSKAYVSALNTVLDYGIKILYVASLNDQVVPIYSGLFTAVSHPLILRALYIDGDAYHSSDFLSNLLVLLLRILNAGMSDSGLIAHLSEATAGSLNGVGHSTAYEEVATYSLAVQYLFMANEGAVEDVKLEVEPFNAALEQNDYEIPWSLRDVIADERVAYFFGKEIAGLRDAFREWHPKTTILRDLKRKLQPIQRLGTGFSAASGASKL
ncbi:hypothetical protein BDN70DRAFT_887238 [Pholiota conissans]|uniref:YMC020W-like alpha/beta hydrolase domain-containing protein n=1 Tax=Pholiota conissans TaxID=109636 RepID=A0A9P5YLW7_9AGAR|nr:hypothetical protein BDN70DRAFT_887238 [Pholiota conissans]